MNTLTLNLPIYNLDITNVVMPYIKENNELKLKVAQLEAQLKEKEVQLKCDNFGCKNKPDFCKDCITESQQCTKSNCENKAYRCECCVKKLLQAYVKEFFEKVKGFKKSELGESDSESESESESKEN